MNDFMIPGRLLGILAGQVAGWMLLMSMVLFPFTGRDVDDTKKNALNYGLKIIKIIIATIGILSLGFFFFMYRKIGSLNEFKDTHIDQVLWAFVIIDLFCLLVLVCQQGGLAHSMFLPIFFLIPSAFIIVVNPSNKLPSTFALLCIVLGCIVFSFRVSHNKERQSPLFRLRIVNFSKICHKGYNWAFLITSVASIAIPGIQLWVMK